MEGHGWPREDTGGRTTWLTRYERPRDRLAPHPPDWLVECEAFVSGCAGRGGSR